MKHILTNHPLDSIANIGVIVRPQSDLSALIKRLNDAFEKHNITLSIESEGAKFLGMKNGVEFGDLIKSSDMLISLGGDGTLLSVCRRSYGWDIPILGIHAGQLGFLTDRKADEIEVCVQDLLKGNYRIDERMMLEVTLEGEKNSIKTVAFNEVVFSRASISSMAKIDAYIDEKPFNAYYGDGVIVCTPTGSTAYNISAGGPIMYPLSKALIITPICPHSLTQRPLVLPSEFELTLKSSDETVLVVDGQDTYDMCEWKQVRVKMAPKTAKLVHSLGRNYFDVLKEKLRWGDA
ncbi:MAG: NAD(+) kinase [Campylobacteraceae bacterium]|nr:NAD(+) kinase [Campylobacteraceae bacterium]